MRKVVGLIVNPIAGMGGKVALKGTDGAQTLEKAVSLGARPEAEGKTYNALVQLRRLEEKPLVLTVGGSMGEDVCKKIGLPYRLILPRPALTTSKDTIRAAELLKEQDAELIIFAGGDGTARDVCSVVGCDIPVIGIPAGVKIQSACFAFSPTLAGQLALRLLREESYTLREAEVVDLDEEAYRTGHVRAELYGYMKVPSVRGYLQSMKQSGFVSDAEKMEGIVDDIIERMQPDVLYAVGSGAMAKQLMRRLDIPFELLGIDVICNGKLVAADAAEQQLYDLSCSGNMEIIVSPIGGQGFLFGRGNHQFSARVLQNVGKNGITVLATIEKLLSFQNRELRVDCGSEKVNALLSGYYRVVAGYHYRIAFPCNREMVQQEGLPD